MQSIADVARAVFSITDTPARGPPAWGDAPEQPAPDWDLFDQAEPDVEFDQRVSW